MLQLPHSARAWSSDAFAGTLKGEIENLAAGTLPLDKGVSSGGRVDDSRITAIVLRSRDDGEAIQAEVGIFFDEIIGGCSCGDDPQPQNAYCELRVRIDKATGEAVFALIAA